MGEVLKKNEDSENSDDFGSESENENISDEQMDVDQEENSMNSRPRVYSNDVSEGKTVFVKNVPFTATNEDLQKCMEAYGPIYYALICIDKYTEHSKGTGFVKFCVSCFMLQEYFSFDQ